MQEPTFKNQDWKSPDKTALPRYLPADETLSPSHDSQATSPLPPTTYSPRSPTPPPY